MLATIRILARDINWPVICANCFSRQATTTVVSSVVFVWDKALVVPYCMECRDAALNRQRDVRLASLIALVLICGLTPFAVVALARLGTDAMAEHRLLGILIAAATSFFTPYAVAAIRQRRRMRLLGQATIAVPVTVLGSYRPTAVNPSHHLLIRSAPLMEFLKEHNDVVV